MEIRALRGEEVEEAGQLLAAALGEAAARHGHAPRWITVAAAAEVVALSRVDEPEGVLAVAEGGRLAGVGLVRRRGDGATLGPLAVVAPSRGLGARLLDELVARADGWGCASIRAYLPAWSPQGFALLAGRSFTAVDVVARLERPAGAPPRIDAARGLEIGAPRPADLAELAALDQRLTGLERQGDLEAQVRFVARRRGALVGFLAAKDGRLGPGLALDVADLGGLLARALAEHSGPATAHLSTAAPTAMLVALGLGFRVAETGYVMSRGLLPPARPPQLYAIQPETY